MNSPTLNGFFFIYTMLVLLACAVAGVMSVAGWTITHRRRMALTSIFFGGYLAELVHIFLYEWLVRGSDVPSTGYYDIPDPALRILFGTVTLGSLWLVVLDLLDVHDTRMAVAPVASFVLTSAITAWLLPYGETRQLLFYTLRQLFLVYIAIYAYVHWRRSSQVSYRNRLARLRKPFIVMCIFTVLIMVEDIAVILLFPIPASDSMVVLYLQERNFSETLLVLYGCWLVFCDVIETLRLRSTESPVAITDDIVRHIDEQMPAYGDEHKLSGREREVLHLVLEDKDNNAIANELVLSVGTIKTHVHNIMKKTGTSNRDELKNSFWSN